MKTRRRWPLNLTRYEMIAAHEACCNYTAPHKWKQAAQARAVGKLKHAIRRLGPQPLRTAP